MADIQQALEREMRLLGIERYRKNRQKSIDRQLESTMKGAQRLLAQAAASLQEALVAWFLKTETGPGRHATGYPLLKQIEPEMAAAITVRCVLDCISTRRLYTRVKMVVASQIEDELRCRAMIEQAPAAWEDLQKRIQHYGAYKTKRRAVIGLMNMLDLKWPRWTQKQKAGVGTILLELLIQSTGIVEAQERTDFFGRTRIELVASEETVRYLEASHAESELLAPVYLPCLEEPLDWHGTLEGGYHSMEVRKRALIKTHDRKYLREVDKKNPEKVFEAVNTLQHTAWRVNAGVYKIMRYFWDAGIAVAGLPSRDELLIPTKPGDIDTNKDARKTWRRQAAEIHDLNVRTRSQRIQIAKALHIAKKYLGRRFWYVSQLDWRGRIYPLSYHLHQQGADYARALLMFAEGKRVSTPEAIRWYKIAGANLYGMDKLSYDERVRWVDDNREMIEDIHARPLQNRSLWESADKPWGFLAWAVDYGSWLKDPENHVSHLPVHLDATQSGIQIMSLLARDSVGAAATNCCDSDKPKDLYGLIAEKTVAELKARAEAGDEVANMWLDVGVDRAAVKRPVMTRVYNATIWSSITYLREWLQDQIRAGTKPPLPTERNFSACRYLAVLIRETIDAEIPSSKSVMQYLDKVAALFVQHQQPIRWVTPLGLLVQQDYRKWRTRRINTRLGDTIRITRLREPTQKFHRTKMVNALAPCYIHSLDAAALMLATLKAKSRGIENFSMIHDSYGTLAADVEAMAEATREAFVEIFSEDRLLEFARGVQEQLPEDVVLPDLPVYGGFNVDNLVSSKYFFS